MLLAEVRLPCGCLCLCDQDGPRRVLEPCPCYPAASSHDRDIPVNWQEQQARIRLLHRARQKRRYARRKAALEG